MAVAPVMAGLSALGGATAGIASAISAKKMREQLDRAREQYMSQGPEQLDMSLMNSDPELRASQLRAMEELQNMYRQGGFTQADRGALELGEDEASRMARGLRQSADMKSRMRGGGGSLQEYLGSVGANQAGAQSAYEANRRNQIAGRDRAYQALGDQTRLAQSVGSQDFREAQAKANMDKWNKQMMDSFRKTGLGLEEQAYGDKMENVGQGFQAGSQVMGSMMDMFGNIKR